MTIGPKRLALSLGLAAIGALVFATGASARTLGSLAPPDNGGCSNCELFQSKTGVGAPKYRVPKGPTGLWTITAWSTQGGGSFDGMARLRVYRPTATNGQFELAKQSAVETVPADGHPSFATSLDVEKGDRLGIRTVSGVSAAYSAGGLTGNIAAIVPCGPSLGQLVGAGTSCPLTSFPNELANVTAKLTPR
jgi:hypothetical protein